MTSHINIVEVGPRDGLQNEKQTIDVETKVELIDRLSNTGLAIIEAGAFVSPKWVPQMAATDAVMAQIKRKQGISYPVLTPNMKGYEGAQAAGADTIAVFGAASESFSQKNINASIDESLERFKPVIESAKADGIRVRGYVSCVLGCPYEGEIPVENVVRVSKALHQMGCYEISLGDTIGVGVAGKAKAMIRAVTSEVPVTALAGHFHDTYGQSLANIWAALEEGKVKGRQLLPPGEVVLDYHARSHRLLTYASVKSEGDAWGKPVLTVWEVLPTDKQVKPIVRWNAASKSSPSDVWARMIDGNTVLHRWQKQQYVGWDIESKAMKYKFDQESFFAPLVVLSGSGKYVFVPEDKQVRVIESVTGKVVSVLPAPQGSSGVAVSEDGRLAAVLSRNALTVWDLTNATTEPDEYQAEAVGTPFSAELRWVGDRRVMVDQGSWGQVLFSLDLRLPLWNYQFDSSAVRESGSRRMRDVIDEHLVYAASVRSGTDRGLAVGAVKLPGPKVEEAAGSLDREALNIMKPGSRVSLDVKCGTHNAEVRAALEKQVADNQWVLQTSAAARLVAEMGRSDTQTVTYRMFGGGEQSATVTPYFSTLKLEVDSKVAWQSGTSTGAPPMIHLREGETAQGELNKWQNPNPGFFETVDLPDKLLDPDKRKGLGVTNVTTRGLEPAE